MKDFAVQYQSVITICKYFESQVGLAVDDIKDIQDHAKLEGLAMQVSFQWYL